MVVSGQLKRGRAPLVIHEFLKGEIDSAAIDAFIDEHDFPIVEGPSCTFVFRGAADAVFLHHWIYGLESAQAFDRLAGSDFWYLVFDLPPSSRVEYKLEVRRGPNRRLIEDAFNPERAYDPFGANSVAHASGYDTPDWTFPDPAAREGTLEDLVLPGGDQEHPLQVYRPARFRESRRYPLLIVHDGPDYLRFSGLQTVLDNLIHRLDIPGLIAVLHHPADRLRTYADDDGHARFLADVLVPELESRYPLVETPRARCLMGASFGAVAALSAAVRYPGLFGNLLLQSGSFAFSDIGEHQRGPAFDPVAAFINDFRSEPTAIAERVFMSCGIYESLIYENRSMAPLLQSTGMDVRFVEARDGHNWLNWRDRLREGLSWLFPGPLWMVYE